MTSAPPWEKKISNLLAQGSWENSLGGGITYLVNLCRVVRQIILSTNEVRGAGRGLMSREVAFMGQVALTICEP